MVQHPMVRNVRIGWLEVVLVLDSLNPQFSNHGDGTPCSGLRIIGQHDLNALSHASTSQSQKCGRFACWIWQRAGRKTMGLDLLKKLARFATNPKYLMATTDETGSKRPKDSFATAEFGGGRNQSNLQVGARHGVRSTGSK